MIKDPISPSSAPLASPPGAAKPPRASGSGSNLKACPFPGCDAAFAKPAHLQRHQLVHDKEQPHACQYCDQKFGRLDSLKRHQGRKHAEHGSPSGDNSTSAAWSEALGATPASSSTNTSAVPPWSDLERAAQLHDQDIGGVAGNSLAALASVAQSQLPVGAMSAASAMLGNAAEAGSGASSALPFHLNSSTWSTSSPSFMPDPANEAMMPSIDDILESFLASSAATSFSGSGSGFFLDGANDIFPAQSAQPFAPSLSDHAVPTPGTSVAAHTATPPSAPSPASHSLQTSCSPFVRAAASSLGTPRMPFPSSPSIPQHSAHRSSDPHHNSRQGSESAAAEKVASETRDLVIKGVVLPRLPQAASAEEIFWLANSRLPTLAPVIPPAFMQQGVQAKTFPVLYIIVSALGTLWHSDPSVREYGLSLWYFTYLAMWTQSGFLIDDSQATAYGLVVALHAQLFAKLSGEKFAGFRKARLGYNTLRATSRERGWRQLDAPFRLAIFAALDSPDQLRFAHDVLQDQRASFEARASALRAAEAAWAAWQEREQATRTAIVMAIMDGQNTPYDASLQPDGSNGIEAFDLGASSVNILLQAVLPTFNIEAWAAKTSMEWLKAILAPSANAFEQSSLQSGGLHSLQVGQIVDEMLNGQEEVTLAVFEKRHTALLELAVLEGLHFAWLGRKHSDGGWVRSMTRAFHPNETAAKAHPTMPWASPNHSSGTSLQDQVHAALARWPSLPFTDVFSSAQTRNSTVDGTLHVHLRWHSVCLEAHGLKGVVEGGCGDEDGEKELFGSS
ncbi:zinc finger [Ceraceosorus bombacis]|uniref:Zinc finger n=1 Tax=Ceraceosorus bombacis TaxID=401625 RepID=A0A0P1BK22_9BASI|nr:zinc finger [Ceraceosorus bombacis]